MKTTDRSLMRKSDVQEHSLPGARRTAARDPALPTAASASRARQALSGPGGPRGNDLLQLQRAIGNRATGSLLGNGQRTVQTRLTIGEAGDRYEREADAVARQVVRQQFSGAGPQTAAATGTLRTRVQRQASSFPEDAEETLKEQKVQRKGDGQSQASPALESRLNARSGGGRPMDAPLRERMESSFDADFTGVRVHTDPEAASLSRSLSAEAFTYGNDIYFGSGNYAPDTAHGTELLAHELTHTLQQGGVRRKAIQRRGGATVGQLLVNSNVISAGLTAGHAWLAYRPTGGGWTTYGTWGNRTPIGMHVNLELGYTPGTANRMTDLDATDVAAFATFRGANNSWGLINNCASFAARGWSQVTGEHLSYTTWGIPNPSALGAGIQAANGGVAAGILPAGGTVGSSRRSGSGLSSSSSSSSGSGSSGSQGSSGSSGSSSSL